jgi:ABC-type transport system involved in multi-copper enzyme maturation permease subunit
MKYLAVLRDSFREALDSKVLYVTVVLSGLMVLFIASISIRQITMQEELEKRASFLQTILGSQQKGMECRVEGFKQTNDADVPWEGDYEFTFVLRVPLKKSDELALKGLRPFIEPQIREALIAWVRIFFIHLNIVEIKPQTGAGGDFKVTVVSKGTKVTRKEDWNHEPVLFFGALPAPWFLSSPAAMVLFIENNLVNAVAGWIIVLLGIVATASFIPNMMRKGTVDLVLSKPVGRSQLLIFKYLGGLTFLFVNALLIIVAVWLCVGLRSGIWSPAFLLTIPLLTFFFAILYAVSTLTAVLTRSTVVCILVTCVAWFVLWLVGLLYGLSHPDPILPESVKAHMSEAQGRERDSKGIDLPPWASKTIDTLYNGLPRTRDLGRLTKQYLSRDLMSEEARKAEGLELPNQPSWGECIGVSMAWIVGLLALSCWRFAKRDY